MDKKNIEDIYKLSPTQYGLLFNTLYAPESPVYFEQTVTTREILDVPNFMRAWRRVVERHPILRTAFFWEDLDEPVQVVMRRAELPVEQQDWRELDPDEQQRRLEAFLEADRRRGFDFSAAPLMRLALIRLDKTMYNVVCSYHHILLDGWSVVLISQEVEAWSEAFREGGTLSLPKPRPFRDYIIWLQRKDWEAEKEYWRQKLDGFTTATSLSIDAAPGGLPNPTATFGRQETGLSAEMTAAMQAFAQQHRITVNTLFQAAWALLLNRYGGEEDVVFGITVHGRPTNLSGFESMVGLFINAIPVRVQILPTSSVLEWLNVLQMEFADLLRYGYSSLVEIQSWTGIPRNKPMFDYILVDQSNPGSISNEQDLNRYHYDLFEINGYPLTVYLDWSSRDALVLRTTYDRQRFDDSAITRLLHHLRTLLVGMIANAEQQLLQVPILTEVERHQLLSEWNGPKTDYPKGQCIHELFEAQVERSPDGVAVVFEDQHLTYQELNRRANQLAHYLRKLGVSPEVLVGISAERSLEMVVGLVGILKAGGAYVPLDPTYPKERLAFMLEDARVPVLLTQEQVFESLSDHEAQVVCLDTGWGVIAGESGENPVHGVMDDNPAYVIYTSGSTGRPKGAINTHGGIRNRLLWKQESYQLTEADRVLQKTPFSFDVSVWEFFWPLLTGACLVVARPEGHKDSAYLVKSIIEQGITTMHFVPSMLRVFVQEDGLEACSSLRRVICSGETLPFDLQERFFTRLDAELHNLYGPTEAAIDVTFWACERESKQQVVPIGRPIANTQIYLLDAHLQPVPVGVPGELHIGGVGLARGYHNRPDLTAEKFIPNPFSAEAGTRLYKTGDLACYLPDGNIRFLGRIDYQVKVHGFRIELGEIEAVLGQSSAVREVVVTAREDVPDEKRLVAYVVSSEGQEPSASEMRRFLQEKLPGYMVPSVFVMLETLPLTPNGKVDRRALPAPDAAQPERLEKFVAPETPLEEKLAEIWAEILGVERIGIFDNFFDLGGDSLRGTQVITRMRRTLGVNVPVHSLLEEPTIAHLALLIEEILIEEIEAKESSRNNGEPKNAYARKRRLG